MSDTDYSQRYVDYLRSPEWAQRRRGALARARYRCERGCGLRATEVNHKTYSRLGRERADDLEALCRWCHMVADYERQEYGTPEQAEDLWDARLDGWANKVYGEGWTYWHTVEEVEAEFGEWLERQGGY